MVRVETNIWMKYASLVVEDEHVRVWVAILQIDNLSLGPSRLVRVFLFALARDAILDVLNRCAHCSGSQ